MRKLIAKMSRSPQIFAAVYKTVFLKYRISQTICGSGLRSGAYFITFSIEGIFLCSVCLSGL